MSGMRKNARIYENKTTKKQVFILTKNKNNVHVEYVASGTKSWFTTGDFRRIFDLIPS